jgi:hypothetical protein
MPKKVTIEEKLFLMKVLLNSSNKCTILSERDKTVLRSIRKDVVKKSK